jgi:hypothetical protein
MEMAAKELRWKHMQVCNIPSVAPQFIQKLLAFKDTSYIHHLSNAWLDVLTFTFPLYIYN